MLSETLRLWLDFNLVPGKLQCVLDIDMTCDHAPFYRVCEWNLKDRVKVGGVSPCNDLSLCD